MYNLTLSYVWLFNIISSNYDFEMATIIRRFLYYFCIFRIFRFPFSCPLLSIQLSIGNNGGKSSLNSGKNSHVRMMTNEQGEEVAKIPENDNDTSTGSWHVLSRWLSLCDWGLWFLGHNSLVTEMRWVWLLQNLVVTGMSH